jgi:hypothetical protein
MYSGPNPSSINPEWPDHSYEYITCLVSGKRKKSIQNRHLQKYGYTKESYIEKFPRAPIISEKSRDNYRKCALSENGRKIRSQNLTNLNLNNKEFQEKRKKSFQEFLDSNRSVIYRERASEKAKKQHVETDLNECISRYFKNKFQGSEDQKNRSKRMKGKNNIINLPGVKEKAIKTYIENSKKGFNSRETRFKKKKYLGTNLTYQSSYELDFLNFCKENNVLNRIENAYVFTSDNYPYNYYEPDYCLDKKIIIEVKSWYIENLQEKKCPGILNLKKQLVESKGYQFLYIKDKKYKEFLEYINNF